MENKENNLEIVFQNLQSSFEQETIQTKEDLIAQILNWAKQQKESVPFFDELVLQSEPVPDIEDSSVSHLKKTEDGKDLQALFSSVPELRQVAEKIEQVIWISDLKTNRILYASPVFETIWGRSRESLYENPEILIDCVHPEDRVQVLVSTSYSGHKTFDQSYRILRPDGSIRWISSRTFLIRNENKKPCCYFCIAQDITDQKQLEQTLRNTLARSSEQANLSHKMSLVKKPEKVLRTLMVAQELRSAIRSALLIFDYPNIGPFGGVELLTTWQASRKITPWPSESQLYEESALWELPQSNRPIVINSIQFDPRLHPKVRDYLMDGNIQTLIIFPLVSLANWIGCLFVYFENEQTFDNIDLRQIKMLVDQASITLNNLRLLVDEAESRREAERANEIKTEFLAMISHELRTPLTSIIGYTTTLLAKDVHWESEDQIDFIQTIQLESFRLQELIDHLLDLSRLEAGILPISPQPVSIHEIVEDAMPQFNSLTIGKKLTIQLPSNLPLVNADKKRISQVLVNLVRNSATYSPKGTEIKISANIQKKFIQINVIDEGPGIKAVDRKKVFRAFQRGNKGENGFQGAGLGLAISKGLVDAHNGRIWIKRKKPPGTSISFTLPLVSENEETENKEDV